MPLQCTRGLFPFFSKASQNLIRPRDFFSSLPFFAQKEEEEERTKEDSPIRFMEHKSSSYTHAKLPSKKKKDGGTKETKILKEAP